MGAVAEGSPSIRAQANLSALGLHEMAASLPDYVRMVAAGERGFAWIGNTYLDDSGRDSPASLNSTGDM